MKIKSTSNSIFTINSSLKEVSFTENIILKKPTKWLYPFYRYSLGKFESENDDKIDEIILEYLSIKSKIKKHIGINGSLSKIYNDDKGNFFINMSRIRGHSDINSKKNMLKDDFYTTITKDTKPELSKNKSVYFSFKSEVESVNFINYLKTFFSRFCLSINKNGSDLNRIDFSMIPYLDFSQEWSDEKLYKHFDLTPEEMKFIEKNIPKYY